MAARTNSDLLRNILTLIVIVIVAIGLEHCAGDLKTLVPLLIPGAIVAGILYLFRKLR